jgi:hypothetical protein
VVVHADKPWEDGVASQVQDLGVSRKNFVIARVDRLDLSIGDSNCLILKRGGSGSIDHAYVNQDYERRFDSNELFAIRLRSLSKANGGKN